jgi:hypothetical protein
MRSIKPARWPVTTGQRGFFDQFRIMFDFDAGEFELRRPPGITYQNKTPSWREDPHLFQSLYKVLMPI